MNISKLALVPITFWTSASTPVSRDRIFVKGEDKVTDITYDATSGMYVVTLEDEIDDGVTINRTIEVPLAQVRLVHKRSDV